MKKAISESKVQRMRNLVMGNHNAKTKVQSGYVTSTIQYSEGDVWIEGGKEWTIKNGITQTVTKLDDVRKSILMPLVCPKCNEKVMKGQLDKLFWKIYGECSDCKISYETDLKISGKYKEYEKAEMTKNLKTYLKDIKMMANDFINETNRKGYITG
jgi:hypothetical protein